MGSFYNKWKLKLYTVIHKSLRDFRPLRYSSRDGHAEGEHVNRGRETPSLCPTLQVLDMCALGDAADVNPVPIKFLRHALQRVSQELMAFTTLVFIILTHSYTHTHTLKTAMYGDFFRWIPSKSVKQYGKNRQKFIHFLKYILSVSESIFTNSRLLDSFLYRPSVRELVKNQRPV
jgi:hypothetical protein